MNMTEKNFGIFNWICEDRKHDLSIQYIYEDPDDPESKSGVRFTKDCTTIVYTAEEWLELVAVVDECFAANDEELDYSSVL